MVILARKNDHHGYRSYHTNVEAVDARLKIRTVLCPVFEGIV